MRITLLVSICLIFLVSCKKENRSNPIHVNAFPKKVFIYNDLSNLPDSLYASFTFYKKENSVLLDSFIRDGLIYMKDTSLSIQVGSFSSLYFGNATYGVRDGFIYTDSLLTSYKWLPFSCDDIFPYSYFSYTYNQDQSLNSYQRETISARCDDHSEDANFEYKNDTLIVNNIRNIYSNYDTIVYLTNEYHYSNLPIFSFFYERRVAGFNGTFYYKYLPLFTPFSPRTFKLIHKIICGDFESDYSYSFNSNGDVTQLDVLSKEQSGDPGYPQLLQYHVKYVFEY